MVNAAGRFYIVARCTGVYDGKSRLIRSTVISEILSNEIKMIVFTEHDKLQRK